MTEQQTYKYEPQTISHPGTTLKRTINALDLTQSELARRAGQTQKHISQIANGKAPITPETALAFERVLDISASFWNARQQKYDEAIARKRDREDLESQVSWLNNFPIQEMIDRGLLKPAKNKIDQLRNLLDYFGVAGIPQWSDEWREVAVSFRQSDIYEASEFAVAAWLRAGEFEGRKVNCQPYDKTVFREALDAVRQATTEDIPDFCRIAQQKFSNAGVALVFTPELPDTRVSGATRWLSPRRALVQMSFRYKRDDSFFFTLFHEAAHILLHPKKAIFLEETESSDSKKEREADQFAGDFLIPPAELQDFLNSTNPRYLSHDDIIGFADSLGIAPGIVVGRLHHERIVPYNHFRSHLRPIDESMIPGDQL